MTDHPDPTLAAVSAEVGDYAALSRAFAGHGDLRRAVLTQWAADIRVLQLLLWENGLGAAPDPAAQLAAVAEAVQASLAHHAVPAGTAATARDIVERGRAGLAAVFDPSVHALLTSRFGPLDHLDTAGQPGEGDVAQPSRYRDWRSPQELLRDLRVAADDSALVARDLAASGDAQEADRQLWQAALALFECYLVESAVRAGDELLSTAETRWELARARLAGGLEGGAEGSSLRARLRGVLGVLEEDGVAGALSSLESSPAGHTR